MRVGDLAHGRSGDKGDTCNVGLVAYTDEGYRVLLREVTAERVAEHFGDLVLGTVTRYELPGIRSLNFVLTGALDGGGTMSLRSDHLGKVMYTWLLRMEIDGSLDLASEPSSAAADPSGSSSSAATNDPPVRVTRRGGLAVVTLARPATRNALDESMARALLAAVEAACADPTARAVAIAADGPAFCAGGDLRAMAAVRAGGGQAAYTWAQPIVDLHRLALRADKPLIALVDGPAYAGGMGLAGLCDIVIATGAARFAMPEVKVGLFPMIIVAHLSRSLPRKLLLDLMLTVRDLDAETAARVGFVNRVVPDTEALWAAADEYAAWFAASGPEAVRLGRRAFTLLSDLPAGQALDAAQFLNVPFFLGRELAEGADAFVSGRAPDWVEGTDG